MFQDRDSQQAVYSSRMIGTLQITFGGILSFLFGITTLACFADLFSSDGTTSFGSFMVIFILFGLFLYMMIRGIQRIRFARIYSYYMKILNQAPYHSIDQLAVMFRTPVHKVRYNLDRMIRKRFLAYAYIDDKTNRIVCTMIYQTQKPAPGFINTPGINLNPMHQVQPQKPIELITATCPNCGASNKLIKGTTAECEYCGSAIIIK